MTAFANPNPSIIDSFLNGGKRVFITLIVLVCLCLSFWLSSRVPALNEKAMMGGSANLTSLSFDILYEPVETAPLHERIAVNAVNWVYTNRQGMTFGLLLAATLMTLLAQFNAAAVKNRFANSAIGLFVGSSLGVCVNCAAPIAQGMSKSGARQETALSTMLSSPTLNFIVLSMVFALFPLYLALLKIALTIVVILIVVPLVVRLFPSASIAEEFDNAQVCSLEDSPMAPMLPLYSDTTWLASLQWVAITFARNLWYIVKIAVPLMLLAGFLGAALITLIPFEKLIDYLPIDNRLQIVASMIALACLCIFLPVPMAFDVVISAVLLAAGMPVMYVAVILFTLGIYSVYGYFIAAQLSSWKTASALFVVLVGIGVLAGISAKVLGDRATIKQNELLVSTLSDLSTDKTPGLIEFIPDDLVMNTSTVRSKADVSLVATQLPLPTTRIHSDNSLTVASIPFEAKSTGQSTNLFDLVDNTQIGVNPPFSFEISQALIMRFRSISSGDINNDHWSDVAVSDSQGLYVYLNQSGQHFVRKELSLPLFEGEYVTNAVLVDIDNDAQLDLFVATYNIGNYIVFNRNGEFLDENTVRLPNHPEALRTVSSVFGDIDRDGDLDIVLGNWSMGVVANKLSLPSSKNVWLKQTPAGFTLESLSGKPGETLSTLLSDINGDGILDLMVGNDFDVPDAFYLGSANGEFKQLVAQEDSQLRSTVTTMSITTTDVNNDLSPELFMSQITEMPDSAPKIKRVGKHICEPIIDDAARDACEQIHSIVKPMSGAIHRTAMSECLSRISQEFQTDCLALLTLFTSTFTGDDAERCDKIPANWQYLKGQCTDYHQYKSTSRYVSSDTDIPNSRRFNVLLAKDNNGEWRNTASASNLELTGWAWNSRFADLDNDGWQDLFVSNGQTGLLSAYSNIMFKNSGNGDFVYYPNSGLESFLDTGSYTYFDYDNDGDLDIAALPQTGPLLFYRNNSSLNSIAFELRDSVSNSHGIGSKITIRYGGNEKLAQYREIQAGGGFISYDAPRAYFGLGEFDTIDSIEIAWSDGAVSKIDGPIDSQQLLRIAR